MLQSELQKFVIELNINGFTISIDWAILTKNLSSDIIGSIILGIQVIHCIYTQRLLTQTFNFKLGLIIPLALGTIASLFGIIGAITG